MAEPRRRRRTVDPGLATVVAAALALVGTVATVVLSHGSDEKSRHGGVSTTTPVSTTTRTSTASPEPDVQIVAGLPQAQKQAVDQAAAAILGVASRLPLLVENGFDERNAPGWPVGRHTYDGGITCTRSIERKRWNVTVTSTNGGAFCRDGVSQVASDLVVKMGTSLSVAANAEISLYVRASSDLKNGYQVGFNPQTQQFWENVLVSGQSTPVVRPTFAAEIKKNAANTLTVLVVGSTHSIFVND